MSDQIQEKTERRASFAFSTLNQIKELLKQLYNLKDESADKIQFSAYVQTQKLHPEYDNIELIEFSNQYVLSNLWDGTIREYFIESKTENQTLRSIV